MARRLEPYNIAPNLVPQLLLAMRLSVSVVVGMALLLLGYRYAGARAL